MAIGYLLRQYLLNTTFHGLRYIAEPDRHWSERIFWSVCCFTSWIFSYALISSTWNSLQNNAISFVVETSSIDWNTEFPSVYVCETSNEEKLAAISDIIFGVGHDINLDEIIAEHAFYNDHYFFTLETCGPNEKRNMEFCKSTNFSYISNLVKSNCAELFQECQWNKALFNCCKYFVKIETDVGTCYGLNSLQTRLENVPVFSTVSNWILGTGSLTLKLFGENRVYILGPLEVPSVSTSKKDFLQLRPNTYVKRGFNLKNVENDPAAKFLTIQQRMCRYANENYLNVFPYYSYSACLVQCQKDAQLKLCGCATNFIPNTPYKLQCNFTGLICFKHHFQQLMVRKSPNSDKLGLVCECLPSCEEVQVDVVAEYVSKHSNDVGILQLALNKLPTERYKRKVIKDGLDVVVSIGSAVALFLGASFLTFFEFFYYFFIRPFNN